MTDRGEAAPRAPAPDHLAALAVATGKPFRSAANAPINLGDPAVAWYVEEGAIDIFLVEVDGDRVTSRLKHVLRAAAGRALFSFPADPGDGGAGMAAVGKGLPGCRMRMIPLEVLLAGGVHDELAEQVDEWVRAVTAALVAGVETHPRPDRRVTPGDAVDAPGGAVVAAAAGAAWVEADGGAALLDGLEPADTGLLPVTPDAWITTDGPGAVTASSSRDLCADGRLPAALEAFHREALAFERTTQRVLVADEANRQRAGASYRARGAEEARRGLFEIMTGLPPGATPLSLALDAVGAHEGIEFVRPADPPEDDPEAAVRAAAAASGVRCREVRLDEADRWWRGDSGAMIGLLNDGARPVALVPGARGYRVVDPVSGRSARIDRRGASLVARTAWSFTRPLPRGRAAGAADLARCAAGRVAPDVLRFVLAGAACGLTSALPAAVLAIAAESVLPFGDAGALPGYAALLAALAAVAGVFSVLRGTALMRIEGRTAARLSAAVWDRVLRLRPEFFRGYTAGDLAARMEVFESLRDQLSGTVGGPLLSVVFLVPGFLVVFAFEPRLGWATLGLGAAALAASAVFGAAQLPLQRRLVKTARELSSELHEFITGVSRLRAAGAEDTAFTSWARRYREQQAAVLGLGRLNGYFVAATAALPALAAALLAAFAALPGAGLGAAAFLAAYAVSMTFFGAVAQLGHAFQALANLAPAVMQVRPLLAEAPPPAPAAGAEAPALAGGIEFRDVTFRYSPDAPPAVDGVSLRARPGEFVAVVGETGCGKSTLLRLALGLHGPESGTVTYDGRDLASLDPRSVRRQVGVVLQNSSLRPGTVLQNIIGVSRRIDVAAAWRAAREAAVAADIEKMPMRMFTPVGEGDAMFSGGQAQRIMIAAALVRRPRIILLDEATSWLDAAAQAKVMASIEALTITRIVIAHRLSTIRGADRIYVMHDGRIVQEGRFDELFETPGRFRELMLRQTI